MAKSVASQILDCWERHQSIKVCLHQLDALNGARNPAASLAEAKSAIARTEQLLAQLQQLGILFEDQLERAKARKAS